MKYSWLVMLLALFMVGCGTTKHVGKLCGTDVNGNTIEYSVVDFEGLSGHSKVVVQVIRNTEGQIVSSQPIWSGGGSSIWPSITTGGAQVGSAYYIGRGLEKSGDNNTTNNNNTTSSRARGGNATGGSATAAASASSANVNLNSNDNRLRNRNANVNLNVD